MISPNQWLLSSLSTLKEPVVRRRADLSFKSYKGMFLQAKQLTLSLKTDALELFVKEGWLTETPNRRGYYSLGVCHSAQCSCSDIINPA